MTTKKSDKNYYILNTSSAVIPVDDYNFNKKETCLKSLVNSECFFINPESKDRKTRLNKMINKIGFEWDPLSETGHLRQVSHAVTIMEAIEKYSWLVAKNFSDEYDIPLYRVNAGELLDSNIPEIKKQILLLTRDSIYGSNQYSVFINKNERILRYNACLQKLSVAKKINLHENNLPVGFFEISKSYRFEEENELRLCKRARSFHIPEIDVINKDVPASLKLALNAHARILDEIKKFDTEFELLCSVTQDFFKENIDFLKTIVKSINKPILLAVYQNDCCKDGVKIDIEYKVFDSLKLPVEIATCLVDDGSSEFSLGLKFKNNGGKKKSVSILHVVFPFSSIERSAYFFIDRAVKEEKKNGFMQFPLWISPTQVRIIPKNDSIDCAKKFAKKLELLGIRVDIDDRKVSYDDKMKREDLKWIHYVVTIDKNSQNLIIENRSAKMKRKIIRQKDLIRELKSKLDRNLAVPIYVPMLLSKRIIF